MDKRELPPILVTLNNNDTSKIIERPYATYYKIRKQGNGRVKRPVEMLSLLIKKNPKSHKIWIKGLAYH